MDKRFIITLVAIIAIVSGVFFFTRDKASSPPSENGDSGQVTSHSVGAGTAGVEIIEFGDFQCPACGSFHPVFKAIKEKYGDEITFTFRHFPLDGIHPNARAAHRSAEAAGLQGKFFDMHDLLFENQTTWRDLTNPVPIFEDYAAQLALNLEKFKADFASASVNDAINADIAEGKEKYQASSTPTIIFNGQKVDSSEVSSIELMSAKIDSLIAETN